jgi:hypothetical protein
MAETRSADDRADGLAGSILILILGPVGLALLVFGGSVYFTVVGQWAVDPRGFHGIDGAVNWVIGILAAIAVAGGLILAGIVLRLMRWNRARLASLVLAILGASFVIGTYLVFSDASTSDDSFELVLLQGCCIVLLLLVALPPFLHWALAKPAIARLPTEPQS